MLMAATTFLVAVCLQVLRLPQIKRHGLKVDKGAPRLHYIHSDNTIQLLICAHLGQRFHAVLSGITATARSSIEKPPILMVLLYDGTFSTPCPPNPPPVASDSS